MCEDDALPCIFGCSYANDRAEHYARCPILQTYVYDSLCGQVAGFRERSKLTMRSSQLDKLNLTAPDFDVVVALAAKHSVYNNLKIGRRDQIIAKKYVLLILLTFEV